MRVGGFFLGGGWWGWGLGDMGEMDWWCLLFRSWGLEGLGVYR